MKQIMQVGVAAATAILGYDLLKDVVGKKEAGGRALIGVGLAGSAVVGDSEIDVYVNSVPVATLKNSSLLVPKKDDILPCRIHVPGNSELALIVTDAPVTSILYSTLLFA